jgi:excinuclease ABC subunit A
MKAADMIIDIGLRLVLWRNLVTQEGTYEEILKCDSLTAKYLNGRKNLCSQKKIENINFVEIKLEKETTFKI